MNFTNIFTNILKGIFIGGANIIPGVSGGTIAFILGIYDKLTEAIAEFFVVDFEQKKKYVKFLTQIGVGVLIGIVIFAKIIGYLYERYQEPTKFFFVGLILASLPIILKENKGKVEKKSIATFIFGFLIIILLGYFNPNKNSDKELIMNFSYFLKLYFCGTIASGAMIVPGISGSLLLLLLGEYNNVLSFIDNRELIPLSIMSLGVVTGILIIAKIIDLLLKKHKNLTVFFIMGLVVASVFSIWPKISIKFLLIDILSLTLGIGLVFFSKKLKKN